MNKIGVLIDLKAEKNVLDEMSKVMSCGFECCQITIWESELYNDRMAKEINEAMQKTGVEISTLWSGWSGPKEWNFTGGPMTLGLVPPAYRMMRAEELIAAAKFAVKIGVQRVATHVGFLPENMNDLEYLGIIAILRYIVKEYKKLGIDFLFETGQETPVALLRVIEELDMDNVGINMDTANLILYGKANSADAVSVFGKYVKDTHIKDGFYPTNGKKLGREVKVGEGLANIPAVIKNLKAVGYTGNFIIEREIGGEQQLKDIVDTKRYLESILKGDI